MPLTRVKKSTGTAGCKIPKAAKVSSENQVRAARCNRSVRGSKPTAPGYHPGNVTTIRVNVFCRKKDSR